MSILRFFFHCKVIKNTLIYKSVKIKSKYIYYLLFFLLNHSISVIYSQDRFNSGILPKTGTNFIMAKSKLYPKIKIRIDELGINDWDISAYSPDDFDTIRIRKANKTQFDRYFPKATDAIIINSLKMKYVYKENGKVLLCGLIDDYMEAGIPVLLKFNERMLLKGNEKNINVEYENVAKSSFCAPFYRKPGTDSIRANIEVKKVARIDAKGWLKTQMGKYKTYREVSFYDKKINGFKYSMFGWVPADEYSTDKHYIEYKWYSEKGGIPIAVAYINNKDYVEEIHYLYNSDMRLYFTGYHVSCKHGSNGKIDLNVKGGIPGYKFEWSNGEKTEDLLNVKAGTYLVKVTDNRGKSISANYSVTEPLIALDINLSKQDVTCRSAKNGKIAVDIKGGKIPYQFTWSNDSTSWEIDSLSPRFYSIIVSDANNCFIQDSIEITQPEKKLRVRLKAKDISCLNGKNGEINTKVVGGTPPYKYKWSNGDTSKIAKKLKAGNYSVIIKDKNECTVSASIFVKQPRTAINIDKDIKNVSCYNGNDGEIELLTTGGKPPYKYLWQDSTKRRKLTNLKKGSYKFTLTDNNNCIVNDEVIVTQPTMALEVTNTKKDVKCFGNNTGEININVNGGTMPYKYLWSNEKTKSSIKKIAEGEYSVKIIDKNLCEIYDTIQILSPNEPLYANAKQKNIKCKGAFEGEIKLFVSGGTAPYSFLWSNKTNRKNVNNLKAGKYNVIIKDKNNCQLIKEYELTQPKTEINIDIEKNNIICFDSKSGSIYLNPEGGDLPYTFEWSNGSTKQDIIGIKAGNYSVSVTDGNLCKIILNIKLTQPKKLKIDAEIKNSEHGKANGEINLKISGGKKPYIIYMENEEQTNIIKNLNAATYNVIVTDANDCEVAKTIEIK